MPFCNITTTSEALRFTGYFTVLEWERHVGARNFDFPSWCRHSSLTFVSSSVLVYVFLLSSHSCSPQLCQLSHLWFGRVNQIMKSLQRLKKRKFTLSIHKGCIFIWGRSKQEAERLRWCSLAPPEMLMKPFLQGTLLLQTKIWLLLRCYSCSSSYPPQTLQVRLPSACATNCVA